jgi:hypothetical protein
VRALLERLLRLFVTVRRPQDSKPLNAGGERDWAGDAGSRAFDGVRYVAGGLVDDPVVIRLQSDANALYSHTKNNCLLMVLLKLSAPGFRETERGIYQAPLPAQEVSPKMLLASFCPSRRA